MVKIVIANKKTGKCYQKEADSGLFKNLKIGSRVKGEELDLAGYELKITGGSDFCGFPMIRSLNGPIRKRILTLKSKGAKKVLGKGKRKQKGIRIKKTVCGNTINSKINQVNMVVIKHGKKQLEEIFAKKEENKKSEEKK